MEIKISKSARTCLRCEREFIHEEEVSSAVRIVEQQLQREDYCRDCWDAVERDNIYSYWSPKFLDPRVLEQVPEESFSPLRKLFYEAAESEVREDQAKAFLAAQLLRRQKVFRLIKESDEAEGELRLYLFSDRVGNRLVEVRDPTFSYKELDAARHTLVQYLRSTEQQETDDNGKSPIDQSA
ncbi:MAG: hypothetical protein HYV26_13935 [Candidatus Hydrogenedentes bacterium]|nr:hypothetical protein [Candidatus Hydrogenedentota bacterium]